MSVNEHQDQRPRLLAIGFLPPPLGGVSVSFRIFREIVERQGEVVLEVVDLSGTSRRGSLAVNALRLARRIWTAAGRCRAVTLYCATTQVPTLGLFVLAVCRLRRRPFVLRKAASMDYRDLGPLRGRVAAFVVARADLFLAQTRRLTDLCLARGLAHTRWFPTSRPQGALIAGDGPCRRFVYVGQVRPSKGAFELVEAARLLPDGASLDVYGPFYDGLGEEIFAGGERIRYRGVLEPDDVAPALARYDAFVLPSKARSEGYPGALLEAFSVGMPVIATTVGGIGEIVDEGCGILVEPGDADAVARAMGRLLAEPETYRRLCLGAREARERFSAEQWSGWLVRQCLELGGGDR